MDANLWIIGRDEVLVIYVLPSIVVSIDQPKIFVWFLVAFFDSVGLSILLINKFYDTLSFGPIAIQ